jgi:hypothetical protein
LSSFEFSLKLHGSYRARQKSEMSHRLPGKESEVTCSIVILRSRRTPTPHTSVRLDPLPSPKHSRDP